MRFMFKSPKRNATTEVSTQCNTTKLYKSHLKKYELSLLGVKPHVYLFLWGQLMDQSSSPNKAHGKTLSWPWSPPGTEQKAGIKVHVLHINVIGLKNVKQIRYIVIRYNYKTRYSILDLYTFQKIKEFIFLHPLRAGKYASLGHTH